MSGDDLAPIQAELADLRRAVDALTVRVTAQESSRDQDRRDLPEQVRGIVVSILQTDMPALVRAELVSALRDVLPEMLRVHDGATRTQDAAEKWEQLTGFFHRLGWAVIVAFGAGVGGSLFLAVRTWLQ